MGILQDMWYEIMLDDPLFGSKSYESKFDPKAVVKVRAALKAGILKPEENFTHLQELMVWILGVFWWFRGSTELVSRTWDEVTFCNKNNRRIVSFKPKRVSDKTNKKKLAKKDVLECLKPIQVREFSSEDPICPVRLVHLYKSRVQNFNVNQVLLFEDGSEVKESSLTPICRSLAVRCGFENAESVTCHSNRKHGVTMAASKANSIAVHKQISSRARHQNLGSIDPYIQPSETETNKFFDDLEMTDERKKASVPTTITPKAIETPRVMDNNVESSRVDNKKLLVLQQKLEKEVIKRKQCNDELDEAVLKHNLKKRKVESQQIIIEENKKELLQQKEEISRLTIVNNDLKDKIRRKDKSMHKKDEKLLITLKELQSELATEKTKSINVSKDVEVKVQMMAMQNKFEIQQKNQKIEFLRQENNRLKEMEQRRFYDRRDNFNCSIM